MNIIKQSDKIILAAMIFATLSIFFIFRKSIILIIISYLFINQCIKYFSTNESQTYSNNTQLVPKKKVCNSNEFMVFPSLINHDHKDINYFINHEKAQQKYYIQEKADGANFSIWHIDGDIKFARRKDFLKPTDNFHGFQDMVPYFTYCIENLYKKYGNVIVYGELLGCIYDNVPVKKGYSKFQPHTQYTNDLEFLAFDVYLIDSQQYLNTSEAQQSLRESKFKVSPILAKYDSLKNALEHPHIFKSELPKYFDMLEHSGENLAEGIVIRPEEHYWCGMNRGLFKKKRVQEKIPISRNNMKPHAFEYLDKYITEERLKTVRSKLLDDASKSTISNSYVEDVFEEIIKEGKEIVERHKAGKYIKKKLGRYLWLTDIYGRFK